MPSTNFVIFSAIVSLSATALAQGVVCNTTAAPDGSLPYTFPEPGQNDSVDPYPFGTVYSKFCDAQIEATNPAPFSTSTAAKPVIFSVERSGTEVGFDFGTCSDIFESIVSDCVLKGKWGGEVVREGVTFEISRA